MQNKIATYAVNLCAYAKYRFGLLLNNFLDGEIGESEEFPGKSGGRKRHHRDAGETTGETFGVYSSRPSCKMKLTLMATNLRDFSRKTLKLSAYL